MTVADLERRLTMRELVHWAEFEADFGPYTIHERIDALIQAHTGEKPKWGRQVPMTEEQVPRWLHAVANRPVN